MPQNRTDIKAAARECLRGRMLRSFVVCLIPMLPSLLMMFFPRMPDALYFIVLEDAASGMVLALTLSPTLTCLSLLLNALVAGPMTVRQAGYFLQLNRDAEHVPSPLSVCDCFGPGYWRLVAATLPSTLILLLIQYLPMLLAVVIPGMAEPVDASDVQMLRLHMPAIVPLVIALVGFYGALRLLMVPYIMAENSGVGVCEVLKRSLTMTRGRVLELAVLQFSFFGWLMAVAVTSGIAAVYVLPYYSPGPAGYYRAFPAGRPAPEPLYKQHDEA